MASRVSDAQLREEVLRALRQDGRFDDARIGVSATDGVVTLTGTVTDYARKIAADRIAARLPGVLRVTNEICVFISSNRASLHKPEASEAADRARPMSSAWPPVTPEEIRERIEQTLEERAQREARRMRVFARGGIVTIEGRVHSWEEKRELIGAISQAPGVQGINDQIHIDPYF